MSDENKKDNSKDNPKEHVYDGIIEHDHPLPRWWVYIFYGTIVFGVAYYAYYELMGGPSLDQELTAELNKIQVLQKDIYNVANESLLARINDPESIKVGAKVFTEKCSMCHGDKGQGTIGPNMTDKFWIHGNKPTDILKTVQTGVADKGMPPWGTVLSSDEQTAVVSFVISLKNTNPPNPKPPQGVEVLD